MVGSVTFSMVRTLFSILVTRQLNSTATPATTTLGSDPFMVISLSSLRPAS